MQDIIAPARDAALMPAPPKTAQPSKHGYVIITLGFSTALGLGLAGGANLHRIVDLDKTATWVWKSGSILQSAFEVARREIGSRISSLTSGPTSVAQASQEVTSAGPNSDGMVERAVTDLSPKVDQVRAANEGSARDLIPTRVKADSFRGFRSGASQIPWWRTGGSPCGQGLRFARTMTQPSFGAWRKRPGTRVKVGGCWRWPRSTTVAPGPKPRRSAASGYRLFGTGLCGSTPTAPAA